MRRGVVRLRPDVGVFSDTPRRFSSNAFFRGRHKPKNEESSRTIRARAPRRRIARRAGAARVRRPHPGVTSRIRRGAFGLSRSSKANTPSLGRVGPTRKPDCASSRGCSARAERTVLRALRTRDAMRGAHAPPRVFSRALRPDDGAASRPPSSVRAGCTAPVRKKTNNDLYGQTVRGCAGDGRQKNRNKHMSD